MNLFKPKKSLIFILLASFTIGLGVPLLIYYQVSSGQSLLKPGVRNWIQILFPTFFLVAGFRVLYILKTIEIDQNTWTVRYVFPRRTVVFTPEDIKFIKKTGYLSYKYRIPITTYTIQLKNAKRINVSSNEIADFETFKRVLRGAKSRVRPEK